MLQVATGLGSGKLLFADNDGRRLTHAEADGRSIECSLRSQNIYFARSLAKGVSLHKQLQHARNHSPNSRFDLHSVRLRANDCAQP